MVEKAKRESVPYFQCSKIAKLRLAKMKKESRVIFGRSWTMFDLASEAINEFCDKHKVKLGE